MGATCCTENKPAQSVPGMKSHPVPTADPAGPIGPLALAHLGAASEEQMQSDPHHQKSQLEATVLELSKDMARLRGSSSAGEFQAMLDSILATRKAPMLLFSIDKLREIHAKGGCLPQFGDVESELIPLSQVQDDDRIIFISHRWWRPGVPDGDFNEKVEIILQICSEPQHNLTPAPGSTIYLWWDYFSICQTEHGSLHDAQKSSQILAIPFYLAAVDTVIALKGGDEAMYLSMHNEAHGGGEESKYPGDYENRVWTMLELFGFTSHFAMQCNTCKVSGKERTPRTLIEVELGFDSSLKKLQTQEVLSDARLQAMQDSLHDTPGWTLPPSCNLTDENDLHYIEPVIIALASDMSGAELMTNEDTALTTDLLAVSARFGFIHAVESFIGLGASVNTPDHRSQHTPLMHAVQGCRPALISLLLANHANPAVTHQKIGCSALHMALSHESASDRTACATPMLDAHSTRNIKLPLDKLGRTPLAVLLNNPGCSATCASDLTLIKTLLEQHHVDPTARDDSKRTASDLALNHAGGEQLVASLESLMSPAQIDACLPRTHISHVDDLVKSGIDAQFPAGGYSVLPELYPDVTLTEGLRYNYDDGNAYCRYEIWAPATPGTTPGLKVLQLMDGVVDFVTAAALVRHFGATVYRPYPWQAKSDPSDVTHAKQAKYGLGFIEQIMGGSADVAIAFCNGGETIARMAAMGGDKRVGSLILQSTPAIPGKDPCKAKIMVFLGSEWVTDPQVGTVEGHPWQQPDFQFEDGTRPFFGFYTSAFQGCAEARARVAAHNIANIHRFLATGPDQPAPLKTRGYMFAGMSEARSPFWAHWHTVTQPALVLAGSDDSFSLTAIEATACLVKNARLEVLAGANHVPHMECPAWARQHMFEFIEAQGFKAS